MTSSKIKEQLEEGKKYLDRLKELGLEVGEDNCEMVGDQYGVSRTIVKNRITFYQEHKDDPVLQEGFVEAPRKNNAAKKATPVAEKKAPASNKKEESPKKEKKVLPKVSGDKIKLPIQELPDAIFVGGSLENVHVEGMMAMSASVVESTLHVDTGEIRYLVDRYDQLQTQRRATENQLLALSSGTDTDLEHEQILRISNSNCALAWIYQQDLNSETQIKKMLTAWVAAQPMGQYLTSIVGIGPIFAARLMASLKIDGVHSAGQFWSYCGQNDNNVQWLGTSKATEIVSAVWKKYDLEKGGTINPLQVYAYTVNQFNINLYTDAQLSLFCTKEKYKKAMTDAAHSVVQHFRDMSTKEGLVVCRNIQDQIDDPLHYDRVDGDLKEFLRLANLPQVGYGEIECLPLIRTIVFMAKELLSQQDPDYIISHILDGVRGDLAENTQGDDPLISAVMEIAKITNRKPSAIMKGATVKASKKKDAAESDNADVGKITKKSMIAYLAKPPYNIALKSACYLIGKSFVFNAGRGSKYGQLYLDRKMYEMEKNFNGEYADIAAQKLSEKNYGKTTAAYKAMSQGKLSDSHIVARSQRWALKIFLAHLFEAMYYEKHHRKARHPYIFAHPVTKASGKEYIRGEFVDEQHERYICPEVDYVSFFDAYWKTHDTK